jgi:hypothetical protein
MACWAVHHKKPGPGGSKAAAGVILQENISDDLRDIVGHFPIADAVDDLALLEPRAQGVEGIQLALVHAGPGYLSAGEIESIGQDDSEGAAEGCNQINPGQVGRDA